MPRCISIINSLLFFCRLKFSTLRRSRTLSLELFNKLSRIGNNVSHYVPYYSKDK